LLPEILILLLAEKLMCKMRTLEISEDWTRKYTNWAVQYVMCVG
jgi:hypothetical protein